MSFKREGGQVEVIRQMCVLNSSKTFTSLFMISKEFIVLLPHVPVTEINYRSQTPAGKIYERAAKSFLNFEIDSLANLLAT